jgi:hypothetical protein
MRDLRTCCECGCVLTGVLCLSCDHILCAHCPPFVSQPTVEELQARIHELGAQLACLKDQLRDSNTVHINILRGTIALKKSQAIHIAGLPANIEEQLAAANKRIEELSAPVSDEEFKKFGIDAYVNRAALRYRIFHACAVNNLIAVRKRK